jgi:hypothetical protein
MWAGNFRDGGDYLEDINGDVLIKNYFRLIMCNSMNWVEVA